MATSTENHGVIAMNHTDGGSVVSASSLGGVDSTTGAFSKPMNSSFVLIKPHAAFASALSSSSLYYRKDSGENHNDASEESDVVRLVMSKLREVPCLSVLSQVRFTARQLRMSGDDKGSVVDIHYGDVARHANRFRAEATAGNGVFSNVGNESALDPRKFDAFFGNEDNNNDSGDEGAPKETWKQAVSSGRVVSATAAMKKFRCTAKELDEAWRCAEQNSKVVALGPSLDCGYLHPPSSASDKAENNNHDQEQQQADEAPQKQEEERQTDQPLYVINGFYPMVKARYTETEANDTGRGPDVPLVYGYEVQWDAQQMTWADFRTNVVGSDGDPAQAQAGSIRREIHDRYQELGLYTEPTARDNIVHSSASPLQALLERCNWMGRRIVQDPYGRCLLARGITERLLTKEYFRNPFVRLPSMPGQRPRLFDLVKDMDGPACLDVLIEIYDAELENARADGGCAGDPCGCTIM